MAPRGPASAFESETFGQDASFRLEQPVGSMSISPSGRDVALASKEGLHIIDLDSPYSPPRYLPHRTPWEVADVQWSPFAARDYWIVSTSNQKALVWNVEARSWQDSIEFVLHGHTRALTDINFSAHNPDVLATCAVDSFVHCWDLRAPLRPVNSFSNWFAGATQVKWSRQDEHVIASSHDKFLHIWDDRKGAYPLRTIEAHGTKIYGIDWNRHQHNKIVTCSLDRTIKFWDFDGPGDMLERVIETPFPVWRARHTPFGWGLIVMPQRGNNDLHLYDRRAVNGVFESGPVRPVATFAGHEGQVKEFLWRARGTIVDSVDHRDFQLVSWGTDRELRLHALAPDTYADIGYEKGKSKVQRLNFTRKGAVYKTFRDVPGDLESPVEETSRSELFGRHNHLLHFRPRASTNVGMNKVPVSQFRGWVQGGRHSYRSGMHGRRANRQSTDPIAWLKNVKISSWDPDTLAEEIRQVGEKFKKVDFEVVDISHRKAVMSLQAPWGEDQTQVYLRVEMRFPKLYPRNANAVLTLQKSGFIDESTHKLLTTELHTIAETYASRKRGCLEAVLRYLLREQNLEQIVAWVLGESLTDSKVLDTTTIPAEDSSSSDDDQLEGIRDGLDASANVLVPLAKGCGALWSDTGKLVCFFPAKGKEPVSFLSTLGVRDLEDSDSSRLFEGFGRLHTSSPARKTGTGTKTADDDSGSETSDSSWKSSSSSSSSFETEQNARGVSSYPVGMSGLHQHSRSPDRSNQSTTGGANKLNDAPRKSAVSIHTFDDLIPTKRELAVDYQIFGNGNEVCKHNASVARNASLDDLASVWTLVGLVLDDAVPLEVIPDLSHTTSQDISIIARAVTRYPRREGGVVPLRRNNVTSGRTRWGNHPLGSTYLLPAIFDHFERLGDVQMLAVMSCVFASALNHGHIPGDSSARQNTNIGHGSRGRSDYFPSKAVARSFLQTEVAPDGYVIVDSVNVLPPGSARSMHGHRGPYMTLSRHASQLSSRAASLGGDDSSDQAHPYSASISVSTSPEGNRFGHRASSSAAKPSARASLSALTQSYSNSPPNQSSSGYASSLKKYSPSGSLASAWVPTGIFGSQGGSKNYRSSFNSEAASQDSREASLRPSSSTTALLSSRRGNALQSSASRRGVRSAGASDVSEPTQPKRPSKRKRIKTQLINQDKFDLDGYPLSPLLDPVFERKCRRYRACYATLLDVWQLHIQRAEILKFDGLATTDDSAASHQQGSSSVSRRLDSTAHVPPHLMERPRRKTMTSSSRATSPCLDIRRCCRNCGQPLAPVQKNDITIGWNCANQLCTASGSGLRATSFKVPQQSTCAICNTRVQGLAVPCLQCGHLTCYDCAQGWFGAGQQGKARGESRRSSEEVPPVDDVDRDVDSTDMDPDDHNTCPTGCGCPCATLISVLAPDPSLEDQPEISLQVPSPSQSQRLVPVSMSRQPSRSGSSTVAAPAAAAAPRSSSLLVPPDSTTPDAMIQALLALTQQTHQRSKSLTVARSKASSVSTGAGSAQHQHHHHQQQQHAATPETQDPSTRELHHQKQDVQHGDDAASAADDDDARLIPWAGNKMATLGRGIGGGLSRGLSSKASDATIRRLRQ